MFIGHKGNCLIFPLDTCKVATVPALNVSQSIKRARHCLSGSLNTLPGHAALPERRVLEAGRCSEFGNGKGSKQLFF